MTSLQLDLGSTLPSDGTEGILVGRVWVPEANGPSPVVLRGDVVIDVSRSFSQSATSASIRTQLLRFTRPKVQRSAASQMSSQTLTQPLVMSRAHGCFLRSTSNRSRPRASRSPSR
jgi:fumarylacetoacetate (FAA) hydrolase family protein